MAKNNDENGQELLGHPVIHVGQQELVVGATVVVEGHKGKVGQVPDDELQANPQ